VAEHDPVRARSPITFAFLSAYMRRYFSRDFRALRVAGESLPPSGKPLILYSNHPSWWDPVIMMLISSLLFPGRKSYAPMDETALGKYRTDIRVRPVRLRAGVAHVARRLPDAVVLPVAIEYTFWNERRPEALVRFGRPVSCPEDDSVAGWTAALESALQQTMTDLAEDGMARDPARFRTLVRGADGIGGIYDLYRRLRALVTGQPFDPSHEGAAR